MLFRHLCFAALLLAGATTNASAHAILVASQPAAGAHIGRGLVTIRLQYNSRIDRARSKLLLISAAREQSTLKVAEDGPPDVLAASADLQPGSYTLRWQVLAIDGHITRGEVPFTVTGP